MDIVRPRCAGIDIGKRSLTVCVITSGTAGEPLKETRTFRTLTRDLLPLGIADVDDRAHAQDARTWP